jgi:hypothetical protein
MGTSLCSIKDRGCCYYYPKFTLFDIQKMSHSEDGMEVLRRILKNPGTRVYNYYIHATGYFDQSGYDSFIKDGMPKVGTVHDDSIFFKACPFVVSGKGCSIPKEYRSYVCNFFLCREICEMAEESPEFKRYMEERDRYVRWLDLEDRSLEYMMMDKGITLKSNLEESLDLLENIPIMEYEFPKLEDIITGEDLKRGA